jgi:thiopurine S-methyltransferase
MNPSTPAPTAEPGHWDQRYRQGTDGWELGKPAPPLEQFLRKHPLAPQPPGPVLVPGCGRGHEAALLEELGFSAIGLDFSGEAIGEARGLHGPERAGLRWLQADLFDQQALEAAGLAPGSLSGIVEHTCFCAIDPGRRDDYIATASRLLAPGGWLLGLFWCHRKPGGPPWGSDPEVVEAQLGQAGLVAEVWEPATGSVDQRQDEWLGLWRQPATLQGASRSMVQAPPPGR